MCITSTINNSLCLRKGMETLDNTRTCAPKPLYQVPQEVVYKPKNSSVNLRSFDEAFEQVHKQDLRVADSYKKE